MQLPFQTEQLNFLTEIANHRTPFLDPIFLFLNYFDTPYFAAFLITLVWLGFSYRWGLKVTYLFFISGLLNYALKYAFELPRPTVAMPELGMFLFKSPGFPSGGAQTAFLFGSLLISQYKNLAAWIVGIFYILLISFSRLYLGLHYPIDILGGWTVGATLFIAFMFLDKPIDYRISHQKKFNNFTIPSITLLSIVLTRIYPLTISVLALTLGSLIALKYKIYKPAPARFQSKLFLGTAAGILTLLFGFFFEKTNIPYLTPISLGFWVSLGLPLLFRYVRCCYSDLK